MTEGLYFGGSKALCKALFTSDEGSGDEEVEVVFASVHGWEVVPSFQHEEEYAQDTVFREAVARHHFKVDVNLKYSKFNPDTALWLASRFLSGASKTEDYTDGENPTGEVIDTSEEFLFDFVGWMQPTAGSVGAENIKIVVSDCYFESFPIAVPENKFVVSDLKAHGRLIALTNPTDEQIEAL